MFGQSSFTVSPPVPSGFNTNMSRMKSPGPRREMYPSSRAAPPTRTSSRQAVQPSREIEVSERFKNRAYNRQPSPLGRVMAPGQASRDESSGTGEERTSSVRERARPPPPRSAVTGSLGTENERGDIGRLEQEKRPRTAEFKKVDHRRASTESNSLEDKIFLAVKDVLSRAVLEKGTIDLNNINTIINDMKNRLKTEETNSYDLEDEGTTHDVNLKRSTTKLNVDPELNSKRNSLPTSKPKPIPGIVRRNITEPPKKNERVYNRIYRDRPSSPLDLPKSNVKDSNNGYESVVYIDLPDSDYSNFNSILKKQEKEIKMAKQRKLDETKKSEELSLKQEKDIEEDKDCSVGDGLQEKPSETTFVENNVGDCHLEASWKTTEDDKLQNYIESLIRNMNDQLNGKISCGVYENQIETEQTVCRSFCVCKVCVSNKVSTSKRTLTEEPSRPSIKDKSQLDIKLQNSATSNSSAAHDSNKQKKPKVVPKGSSKEPHFRVLQRNANFQPDSKLNLASRLVPGGPEPGARGPRSVVAPEEAGEDLYLRRRISKSPAKKRVSTRI